MRMSGAMAFALTCFVVAIVSPNAARGQHYEEHHWHGGDIRHFHTHDFVVWRGGHWYHGYHDGRPGWWWIVGGVYYWYPQAVYPYPDPYTPPVVLAEPPPAPAQSAPPPAPAPSAPVAQSWYYCGSAKNYYPYVAACPEGWRAVPATPPS